MDKLPRKEDSTLQQAFSEADATIVGILKDCKEKKTQEALSYSYGGKDIAVTCAGCEAPIARAESIRICLESFASTNVDPMVKEGISKLIEIARRDEVQARERSLMHHHFPLSLLGYDAFMK